MKPSGVTQVHILPSFHHDIAYLKPCSDYMPVCYQILDEALRLLAEWPNYRFAVEQVYLLEDYWERFPDKREAMKRFAQEGRLSIAPGMYVVPDMNHPGGEAMFLQVKIGKQWVRKTLGVDPRVCWIIDCWGHHAQLPQVMRQCGYEYYIFARTMRTDLMKLDFIWQGLDGSRLKTHWAGMGGGIRFPAEGELRTLEDLDRANCGPRHIEEACLRLEQWGPNESVVLGNWGDMMFPQPMTPKAAEVLATMDVPRVRLSSAQEFMDSVAWQSKPLLAGEMNSSLQGTFTTNIRIKQRNRELTNRLLGIEAMSVVAQDRPRGYTDLWKLVLKQQFHDTICGTITDQAIREWEAEVTEADAGMKRAVEDLSPRDGAHAVFNPLSWARREIIEKDGKRLVADVPAMGFARIDTAKPLAAKPITPLPLQWENPFFRATISQDGHITSLIDARNGRELTRPQPCPFGSLAMQMDYGDSWLNFEGPLNGGSMQSLLTIQQRDPYDRSNGSVVNLGTVRAKVDAATVTCNSDELLVITQTGTLSFWQLVIPFATTIRLAKHRPWIEYETAIQPSGRHYRIRAAFPSAIKAGTIRHEIPFGIQVRSTGEHVAQNWMSYSDGNAGLALLNNGTPASNVDDDILMLTLFRSTAMEYKCPSVLSFNDGIPHRFRYGVMPCTTGEELALVRAGHEFNNPPIPCRVDPRATKQDAWGIESGDAIISGLRWSDEGVFVRVFEPVGRETSVVLSIPREFTEYAEADGTEQPTGPFQACSGRISAKLTPFQIRGFLLRRPGLCK